jgi:hypothetical protein
LLFVFLLTGGAAGCLHRAPTVPESQDSALPPETIQQNAPLRARIDPLDQQIAQTRLDLDDANQRLDLQQRRVKAGMRGVASDVELKEIAVERGDPQSAQSADVSRSARRERLERARADLDAARIHRDRTEARLDLLQRERDLTEAQVELNRARGVADRTDFDVRPYEVAVRDAAARRDDAAYELQRLPPDPLAEP